MNSINWLYYVVSVYLFGFFFTNIMFSTCMLLISCNVIALSMRCRLKCWVLPENIERY